MSAERTLTDFVRALRSAEVEVSPAEAIDGARTLALTGYDDRQVLKDALRPVLAKSQEEAITYDRLFDLYFQARARPDEPEAAADEGATQGDADAAPDLGESRLGQDEEAAESPPPDDMAQLVASGDETAIAMALERAGQAAGVQDIRFSTQTAWFAQKMMKQMGVEALEARLLERLQARGDDAAEGEAQALMDARREIMMRARAHVERQFEIFGAGATEQFRNDYLGEKRISALDQRDLHRMQALVEKIARKLAVKYSRRQRKTNRGQIDIRRTLRRNAGFDGVPFELHWKQKHRDRPKIICICDVSGSVARYVRFLLLLLHSLREAVPDLSAYAFSARLRNVGDWLDTDGFEAAMTRIVQEVGMGSTDYGQALSDLKVNHWNEIDRRTSLIILGDGRSNYGDPRLDLFAEAAKRAKRTIWLNPEPAPLWGTGDSVIPRYRPHCDVMSHVATLKHLERAVDEVLAAYG